MKDIIEKVFGEMFFEEENTDFDYYTANVLRNMVYEKLKNQSNDNHIVYFKTGIVDKPLFIGSREDCIIELNKILDQTDFQWQINEYPSQIIAFTKMCQGKVLLKEDVCPEFFNISKGFFYIKQPSYNSLDIDHFNATILSNY